MLMYCKDLVYIGSFWIVCFSLLIAFSKVLFPAQIMSSTKQIANTLRFPFLLSRKYLNQFLIQ